MLVLINLEKEVEHILEKIGSVGGVLDAINEGAVKKVQEMHVCSLMPI
ncbi:MAG: hypothetical protein ACLUOO_10450 [Coprococcus sp.]